MSYQILRLTIQRSVLSFLIIILAKRTLIGSCNCHTNTLIYQSLNTIPKFHGIWGIPSHYLVLAILVLVFAPIDWSLQLFRELDFFRDLDLELV
jgi:hypothetical protein